MSDTPTTPTSWTGSWVDLTGEVGSGAMSPVIPLALGNDSHFVRMLREAQGASSARTSCRTSCRVSPFMSSSHSPKSPPSSPNNEREEYPDNTDLSDVYINNIKDGEISDFIWDWSSRPNILPPKQWKQMSSSKSSTKSFTVFKTSKSKNKFVYTVVITNIISLILGAGIGIWLFRSSDPSPEKMIQI